MSISSTALRLEDVLGPAIPAPFEHQTATTDFVNSTKKCYVMNEPGTGKTRSMLDVISDYVKEFDKRALVFAPKSILEPSWVDDCRKFTPRLSIIPAYAENRAAAFASNARIVVTNHDAAKWVAARPEILRDFGALFLDEATAYKNRGSQRSASIAKVAHQHPWDIITLLCGTPIPQSIEDIWHQVYLIDGGERLGKSFYKFRAAVCEPVQEGAFVRWKEREGARDIVADLISDITILYRLQDCISMPERVFTTLDVDLTPGLQRQYDRMVRDAIIELEAGDVSAVHAAALRTKLLQIASGAVYDANGAYHVLETARYDLVAELCAQREHSLVAFLWRHQRDQLVAAFERAGISNYAVIDGETEDVAQIVRDFQAGKYKVLAAHPKSASHGLTLTKATTTIWPSPTPEAERYIQFNQRTYRAGQKERTEFIRIRARGTIEERAYDQLDGKIVGQEDLLSLLRALRPNK
jgi:SNF2 family DNA or RNA helicase